jgi:hypothetical protein
LKKLSHFVPALGTAIVRRIRFFATVPSYSIGAIYVPNTTYKISKKLVALVSYLIHQLFWGFRRGFRQTQAFSIDSDVSERLFLG